ncbi:MAG: pentapeptide repeat-containing protein [Caulobacter sp.]|nr:pentapeptide repeat-containing protein [Caulobacter sp.]
MISRRASSAPRGAKLDARAFESIVRAHEAFVTGRPGGSRILPRYVVANGFRCDLRKLSDADFTGADLSGTTFVGTDLRRAALYCARMAGCDLRGAHLDRADLRGAVLSGANLAGATLDEADMRAAILCAADPVLGLRWIGGASMGGARMDRADLTGAEAHAVDFTGCSLRGAKLRNANLKNAVLVGANLHGVDLRGARIEGVKLEGTILTGVDLPALGISPKALAGCVVDPTPEAMAQRPRLASIVDQGEAWANSNGKTGAPCNLDDEDVRPLGALLSGRTLPAFSARRALLVDMNLSESQLAGARFDGADLRGVNFRNCDLRGASFRGARLSHAAFQDADLGPLPLRDGRERPVDFEGAVLTGTGITPRRPPPPALSAADRPRVSATVATLEI